jgi:D-tyrosyl-tRNA(Tyr) deacylase
MRAVVQRACRAAVEVDGRVTGAIARGLVVFLGIRRGDGDAEVQYLAEKILDLRIFPEGAEAGAGTGAESGAESESESESGAGAGAGAGEKVRERTGRARETINRSLRDAGGEILLISQFTLYGDCRRGRRPSFDQAEAPERAAAVYRAFADYLTARGYPPREGVFGARMLVRVENEGPVTILLDSEKAF